MPDFASQKIYIIGLGISGLAAARALNKLGHKIFIYDDNKKATDFLEELPNCEFINYNKINWKEIDYLLLSPAIPTSLPQIHPAVKNAQDHKVKITVDIELFANLVPKANIIAITGTNGKSTTTALLKHIFSISGHETYMGGNIGYAVFDLPLKNEDNIYYVLELSSFQLELIDRASFSAAILLNLTEDHLDRHGDITKYLQAKLNIFKNSRKNYLALINKNMENLAEIKTLASKLKINFFHDLSKNYGNDINIAKFGSHENLSAAILTAEFFNISHAKILLALTSFKSLPHRLEYLGEINNIEIYNDSKATNAESTKNALLKFDNICLILGGVAKSSGLKPLENYLYMVKKIFLIGAAKERFANELTQFNFNNFQILNSLEEAFTNSLDYCKKSEKKMTILFSPACASFDMWHNFMHRGENFKEIYQKYKNGETLQS
jgi:UDP-N-acetylmuramoylalanine--D-glutamate ligase